MHVSVHMGTHTAQHSACHAAHVHQASLPKYPHKPTVQYVLSRV